MYVGHHLKTNSLYFEDLVHCHVSDPDISAGIDIQSVGHVKHLRPPVIFQRPRCSIQHDDCIVHDWSFASSSVLVLIVERPAKISKKNNIRCSGLVTVEEAAMKPQEVVFKYRETTPRFYIRMYIAPVRPNYVKQTGRQ